MSSVEQESRCRRRGARVAEKPQTSQDLPCAATDTLSNIYEQTNPYQVCICVSSSWPSSLRHSILGDERISLSGTHQVGKIGCIGVEGGTKKVFFVPVLQSAFLNGPAKNAPHFFRGECVRLRAWWHSFHFGKYTTWPILDSIYIPVFQPAQFQHESLANNRSPRHGTSGDCSPGDAAAASI